MAKEIDATEGAIELADAEGLDLSKVKGTGEAGRVTKGDVEAYAEAHPAKAGKAKADPNLAAIKNADTLQALLALEVDREAYFVHLQARAIELTAPLYLKPHERAAHKERLAAEAEAAKK